MINSFRNVSYNYFLNICYSVAKSCPTLCDPMDCSLLASLAFTISQSSLKLMSTQSVMPSDHLILCHPFLLLPSICPSIRVFSSKSAFQKSGGQSIGASASVSVLPMNIQGWFSLGLTSLISLLSKGLSRVFSSSTGWKHQFLGTIIKYQRLGGL